MCHVEHRASAAHAEDVDPRRAVLPCERRVGAGGGAEDEGPAVRPEQRAQLAERQRERPHRHRGRGRTRVLVVALPSPPRPTARPDAPPRGGRPSGAAGARAASPPGRRGGGRGRGRGSRCPTRRRSGDRGRAGRARRGPPPPARRRELPPFARPSGSPAGSTPQPCRDRPRADPLTAPASPRAASAAACSGSPRPCRTSGGGLGGVGAPRGGRGGDRDPPIGPLADAVRHDPLHLAERHVDQAPFVGVQGGRRPGLPSALTSAARASACSLRARSRRSRKPAHSTRSGSSPPAPA